MAIKSVTVAYGQSLQDVAMQKLGDASGVWHLADMNGLASITDIPAPGTVLRYDTAAVKAPYAAKHYEQHRVVVVNNTPSPSQPSTCTGGFGCGRFETTLSF